MAADTNIEWCDHTFNPWEGCQHAGPGCDNCYAEARNARFGGGTSPNWGPGAPRRRTSATTWTLPRRWNAQAEAFANQHGRRQRVFCASLADVFDNAVDPLWRADLFALIQQTPNLDWLLLTKRIGNVRGMLSELVHPHDPDLSLLDLMPLPNVWLGATIVNQAEADRDIPKLLAVPARRRFLSMEPLLAPVDLSAHLAPPELPWLVSGTPLCNDLPCHMGCARKGPHYPGEFGCRWSKVNTGDSLPTLDWVIVGGESGPNARPMHPDWARSLRDQCAMAGVPFLFKQWGEWHTKAYLADTGEPVFRQFNSFQQWVNKASTWVQGGICLDRNGRDLRNGGDMARARDADNFPATIMHKVGKKAAGRLLDGRTWDGAPPQ